MITMSTIPDACGESPSPVLRTNSHLRLGTGALSHTIPAAWSVWIPRVDHTTTDCDPAEGTMTEAPCSRARSSRTHASARSPKGSWRDDKYLMLVVRNKHSVPVWNLD